MVLTHRARPSCLRSPFKLLAAFTVWLSTAPFAMAALSGMTVSTTYTQTGLISDMIIAVTTTVNVHQSTRVRLDLPVGEFAISASPITSIVSPPISSLTSSTYDATTGQLTIAIANPAALLAPVTLTFRITNIKLPKSVRSWRQGAVTLIDGTTNVLYDGPGVVALSPITAGSIVNAEWKSATATPGVLCTQTISFILMGEVETGGSFSIVLPSAPDWGIPPGLATLTFTSPAGVTAQAVWTASSKTLTLTIHTTIAAQSTVTFAIGGVRTPTGAMGLGVASITSYDASSTIIDGPSRLWINPILPGEIVSPTIVPFPASPNIPSTLTLQFTVTGAILQGGSVKLQFPCIGWSARNPTATSTTSGVTLTPEWVPAACLLNLNVATGSIGAGVTTTFTVNGLRTPPGIRASDTVFIETRSPAGLTIDRVNSVTLPAIAAGSITVASWTPVIGSPALISDQNLEFVLTGAVGVGGRIIINTANDGWQIPDQVADVILPGRTCTCSVSFNAVLLELSIGIVSGGLAEGDVVQITIVHVTNPPSVRSSRIMAIKSYDASSTLIDSGTIAISAITPGTLTGALSFLPYAYSPGPVALMASTVTISFTTVGLLGSGSRVVVNGISANWGIVNSPELRIISPSSVSGHAIWTPGSNALSIWIDSGLIAASSAVVFELANVINPPHPQGAGGGTISTIASDGSLVDGPTAIAIGAIVSEVTGLTAASAPTFAVARQAKTFTAVGSGISQGSSPDMVKFVDPSAISDLDCNSNAKSVPAGGSAAAQVANGDFTLSFTTPTTPGNGYKLCYKHGTAPFKLYSSITLNVGKLDDPSALVGQAGHAVVGTQKTLSFSGPGLAAGDTIVWLTSGSDCTDSTAYAVVFENVNSFITIISTSGRLTASFTFADPTANPQVLTLCYQYGSEPLLLYPSVTIRVHQLTGFSAVDGDNALAVAGQVKRFQFTGSGVSVADSIRWITSGTDCTQNIAPVLDDNIGRTPLYNLPVTVRNINTGYIYFASSTFHPSLAGSIVSLCYSFVGEPYAYYGSMTVTIRAVSSATSTPGSAPLMAIAGVPETFHFTGEGLHAGDAIKWVVEAPSGSGLSPCAVGAGSGVPFKDGGGIMVTSASLDNSLNVVCEFPAEAAGSRYQLCYRHGTEIAFTSYPQIEASIGIVRGLRSIVGSQQVAVAGVSKLFSFYGDFLEPGDQVSWISSGASCAANAVSVMTTASSIASTIVSLGSKTDASFIFPSSSIGQTLSLCYAGNGEPLKLYTSFQLTIIGVQSFYASTDTGNVYVVARQAKSATVAGAGVASGDRVKFIEASKSCNGSTGAAMLPSQFTNLDSVSMTISTSFATLSTVQVSINASRVASGGPWVLCYQFGSEDFAKYGSLTLLVRDLKLVNSLEGSPQYAITNVPKSLSFTGYYLSTGDLVKWVLATETCSANPNGGIANVALTSASAGDTRRSTAIVTFLTPSQSTRLFLCYQFVGEPWLSFNDLQLEIGELPSFAVVGGSAISSRDVVVGSVKQYRITNPSGIASTEDDLYKWVSGYFQQQGGNDCGVGAQYALPGSGGEFKLARLPDNTTSLQVLFSRPLSEGGAAAVLCLSMHGTEPYILLPSMRVTVHSIERADTVSAFVGISTLISFYGVGISHNDMAWWVEPGVPCDSLSVIRYGVPATDSSSPPKSARVSDSKAEFVFGADSPAMLLHLCYQFLTEPPAKFPNVTLTLVRPGITSASIDAVVVDRPTNLELTGTVGDSSEEERIKWVINEAPDCSAVFDASQEFVMTRRTFWSLDKAQGDTTVVIPSSSALSSSLVKLCYMYGGLGYKLSPNIYLEMLSIDAVTIRKLVPNVPLLSSRSLLTGSPLEFKFFGSGIREGDLFLVIQAQPFGTGDEVCSSSAPAGGSSIANVSSWSTGALVFTTRADTVQLCYKFQRDSEQKYRWFPSAKIQLENANDDKDSISATDLAEEPQFVEILRSETATVTLRMLMDTSTVIANSQLETDLRIAFVTDMAQALGCSASRIAVPQIRNRDRTGAVFDMTLAAPPSSAEPLTAELVLRLQQQFISQANSPLFDNSRTTSSLDRGYYLRIGPSSSPPPVSAGFKLGVQDYQKYGLFEFGKSEFRFTTADDKINIPVFRRHGTTGKVAVHYASVDGTAIGGVHYVALNNDLAFGHGQDKNDIIITIKNAFPPNMHYHSFSIVLSPLIPRTDTGIGTATVRIYKTGGVQQLTSVRFNQSSTYQGWSLVGNGAGDVSSLALDTNGLYGTDELVGPEEYDESCGIASRQQCGSTSGQCSDNASWNLDVADKVLKLDGISGYVMTQTPVRNFPNEALTVGLWIRTETSQEPSRGSTILGYRQLLSNVKHEILIHSPSNICISLFEKVGPSPPGLCTGVSVADGAWHHVAVTWSSLSGQLELFVDGFSRFSRSGYKQGQKLRDGGCISIGQLPKTWCTDLQRCDVEEDMGLSADVQGVQVWDGVLKQSELVLALRPPFGNPKRNLFAYWQVSNRTQITITDTSPAGGHDGIISSSGAITVSGKPSLMRTASCGEISSSIWYFSAPASMLQNLKEAYGGRLSFRLLAASHNGRVRSARGAIKILSPEGELSYWLQSFSTPVADRWYYYVAILREDHGWVLEPTGEIPGRSKLMRILASATALLIRGDNWIYSSLGYGQELVYINDVGLYTDVRVEAA